MPILPNDNTKSNDHLSFVGSRNKDLDVLSKRSSIANSLSAKSYLSKRLHRSLGHSVKDFRNKSNTWTKAKYNTQASENGDDDARSRERQLNNNSSLGQRMKQRLNSQNPQTPIDSSRMSQTQKYKQGSNIFNAKNPEKPNYE